MSTNQYSRFLCAPSSRSPLGCSREQLQFILTHHQVMPSFLDFVFAFKGREKPLTQAFFRHESYLEQDDSVFHLPSLGRSPIMIQHAFNILSVEQSEEKGKPWPLRQTALYHSFDAQYGRSSWIVLKGDSSMRKRIPLAARDQADMKPAAMNSPARSFVASLHVHLVVLEWCAENWGDFIDDLDAKRSTSAIDVRVAPVAEMTSPQQIAQTFSRKGTIDSTASRQSTFYSTDSRAGRPGSSAQSSPTGRSFRRSFSDFLRRESDLRTVKESSVPEEEATEGDDVLNKSSDFDLKFSFDEFQRLSLFEDELERAIIAIEQNKEVLAEIREHYKAVLDSPTFKATVHWEECSGKISTFFRRLRSIDRELDMHLVRLRSLLRALATDKVVVCLPPGRVILDQRANNPCYPEKFDAALQYKSGRTSEYFATSAKISSDRMEDWTQKMHQIAVKTEQETVSMHVITIFTLIFLPGTFLAVRLAAPQLLSETFTAALTLWQTFFSSGVLNWNDEGLLESDWVVRPDALRLFMVICVPMMALIIAGWSLMYTLVRRKRKAAKSGTTDGYADEKGMTPEPSTGLGGPTGNVPNQ